MDPIHFTLHQRPTTKKNSPRVVYIGARCPKCRRGALPIVRSSEEYEEFEAATVGPLQRWWAAREPVRVPCSNCKATGKRKGKTCLRCVGIKSCARPLSVPVLVEAIVYRDARRGDLNGYTQCIGDILQVAGILENDSLIAGWPMPADGRLSLRKDAARPRVEVTIFPVAGEQLHLDA